MHLRWLVGLTIFAVILVHLQRRPGGGPPVPPPSSATVPGPSTAPSPDQVDNAASMSSSSSKSMSLAPRDQTPTIDSEPKFRERFPGAWSFDRNSRGRLRSISGPGMDVHLNTPADVPNFLRMIAPLLDVPADEMLAQPVQVNSVTSATQTFELKQVKDGLEVFGGVIRIHARKADGAVYIVDNLTSSVSGYNAVPAVSQSQAEDAIKSKYGAAATTRFVRGPVIFANQGTELAWVFTVQTVAHRQKLLIVVGAASGRILSEQLLTQK